ncbi:MAG: hypothetical protein PUF49_05865 [Firmicutes bacterium]|nr:hypothetical protein [Bacillota bacterium]
MDYIRDRENNIPFSLHDSRILQIEINETTFQGWIGQEENDPIFGIMRIWNTGDMIYRI